MPSDVDDGTLAWVDGYGKADPVQAPDRAYETPRISPRGQQLAFMTPGPKIGILNFRRTLLALGGVLAEEVAQLFVAGLGWTTEHMMMARTNP
jgi:hypothetical protein